MRKLVSGIARAWLLGGLILCAGSAHGEGADPKPQPPPPPPNPSPRVPPPAPARSRESELEERLRRLEARYEAMERRHAEEVDGLRKQIDQLRPAGGNPGDADADASPRGILPSDNAGFRRSNQDARSEAGTGARDNVIEPDDDRPASNSSRPRGSIGDTSREGGAGARDNPSEPRKGRDGVKRYPTRVEFGPGFEISTDDDEFQLQFHNLTQVDIRQYNQPYQDPVHSGFSIPRQRWYFTGRMTRKVEFYTTINRGFGTLDVYDAFLNFKYDDHLMFKVGRFKTPFSYEFYAMSAPDFIVPERSLFASNFSPNRQLGLMTWGQVLSKRLDYAVGLFNGNRLSFQDTNEEKDVIAYLNARPFGKADEKGPWAPLRNLNIGGSADHGDQNSAPLPTVLRTSLAASNATDAGNIAPPFLTFNKNVFERGMRTLWGLHAAYYYKGLSLVGEWQSGFQTYTTDLKTPVKLPVEGYYVAAGYFLTGESIDRRTQVDPIRPFNLKKGKFGPGAIELQGRYSALRMGNNVFTRGLADPNLWTNHLYTFDLGINWYLNTYTKIVFEWEHAAFGDPVYAAPGRWHLTDDLFWTRFQLYF